jgi:hypothetical protein
LEHAYTGTRIASPRSLQLLAFQTGSPHHACAQRYRPGRYSGAAALRHDRCKGWGSIPLPARGSAIVQSVGYDATGTTAGSYVVAPEVSGEARAIFGRAFTRACPIFATGEYLPRGGTCLCLSALTLPLSDDDRSAVTKTISTLAARISAELKPERGWLAGVPVRVSNVCAVRDAAELERICREWEQSCWTCN